MVVVSHTWDDNLKDSEFIRRGGHTECTRTVDTANPGPRPAPHRRLLTSCECWRSGLYSLHGLNGDRDTRTPHY